MTANIVLKDALLANITYAPRNTDTNKVIYIATGTSLLDVRRLELSLKDNGSTNRVIGKLSIPTVGTSPSTGLPSVQWTEVGSFDLASVKGATKVAAEDFFAQFASFAGHASVKSMYVDGVRL